MGFRGYWSRYPACPMRSSTGSSLEGGDAPYVIPVCIDHSAALKGHGTRKGTYGGLPRSVLSYLAPVPRPFNQKAQSVFAAIRRHQS